MKLLHIGMILLLGACSVDKEVTTPTPTPEPSLPHTGVIKGSDLTIHGRHAIEEMASLYARLPKSLEKSQDPYIIDLLNRGAHLDSAGLYIAFETDAKKIDVNFKLHTQPKTGNNSSGVNNPGSSYFDLYLLKGTEWTYEKSFMGESGTTTVLGSYDNSTGTMNKYMILFPTYNGLANTKEDDFTITIPKDAKIYDRNFFGEDKRKPIFIYGTSITHGAWASRPGLTYTALVMFEQKREVINLGFAGRAFMCSVIADHVATAPSEVLFIDPTLNIADLDDNKQRKDYAKNMIRTYRDKNPRTPIVMVSQFDGRLTKPEDKNTEGEWGQLMKEVIDELKQDKVKGLYFIKRDNLIPDTGPDKVHTTDLGMEQWAKKYNDLLKTLLK